MTVKFLCVRKSSTVRSNPMLLPLDNNLTLLYYQMSALADRLCGGLFGLFREGHVVESLHDLESRLLFFIVGL